MGLKRRVKFGMLVCVLAIGSTRGVLAQRPAQVIDSIIPGVAPVVVPSELDRSYQRTMTRWIADEGEGAAGDASDSATKKSADAADKSVPEHADEKPSADDEIIQKGRAAFENSCTTCHDADRSLKKRKTKANWLVTIRRMANLEDA